jgi:hypothetical protein
MRRINKFTAPAIGLMASGLLLTSPVFAQTAPAQTAQAEKQRTQDTGPNCDFSVPANRLSPDCRNIKQGLDAAKAK